MRAGRCRTGSALLPFAVAALVACAGGAPLGGLTGLLGAGSASRLDQDTVVAGLKEALRVGSGNAVDSTSRVDGYLGNPAIRIPLPDELSGMAKALRTVGLGARVDELEVAMNRAAERAAGEAADVFLAGIRDMSFTDAYGILNGGETAATDYFRRTTSDELRRRFQPIVDQKMRQVGLVQLYDELVGRYTSLPFASEPPLDLRAYVTERGLDGLFSVLAQEERRIRTDPSARVTELLQRVFGSQSG